MFLLEQYAMLKVTTSVRSAVFPPWHRPTKRLWACRHSCLKSAQEFAVQVCQVAMVMKTAKLVLSQF